MSFYPAIPGKRTTLYLVVAVAICAAIAFIFIKTRPNSTAETIEKLPPKKYPGLNLNDPEASFLTLRYVNETGGDPITRSQAIVWLDQQARTRLPAPAEQETYLLEMLASGGHPSWDIEHTLWLFNSTFDFLHHSADPKPLTKILLNLAAKHPHRTMRLYALQHIGVQRQQGRLTGSLAEQVLELLKKQSDQADPEVCGSAIRLLLTWDKEQPKATPDLIARALEIANSSSHPIDARITALHAADANALSTSRTLAADLQQPILLRKAAIALIGTHGGANDIPALETYVKENFRLAQAAEPARDTIQHRLNNPDTPQAIPF